MLFLTLSSSKCVPHLQRKASAPIGTGGGGQPVSFPTESSGWTQCDSTSNALLSGLLASNPVITHRQQHPLLSQTWYSSPYPLHPTPVASEVLPLNFHVTTTPGVLTLSGHDIYHQGGLSYMTQPRGSDFTDLRQAEQTLHLYRVLRGWWRCRDHTWTNLFCFITTTAKTQRPDALWLNWNTW